VLAYRRCPGKKAVKWMWYYGGGAAAYILFNGLLFWHYPSLYLLSFPVRLLANGGNQIRDISVTRVQLWLTYCYI